MQRIIKANIDRFNKLLESETDPTKRAMVLRLLAEEEDKLKKLGDADRDKNVLI